MKPIRIFAYGSLLNENSLRKTVPNATNIFPAKVFGFKRVFNLASHYRYCPAIDKPVCVLNLKQSDPDFQLNGICFEMDESSFDALMSREQIYEMHEVGIRHFDNDEPLPSAKLFWAKNHEMYRYLSNSHAQSHYLDLCIRGCERFGPQFLNEFRMSTEFWSIDSDEDIKQIWQGNF